MRPSHSLIIALAVTLGAPALVSAQAPDPVPTDKPAGPTDPTGPTGSTGTPSDKPGEAAEKPPTPAEIEAAKKLFAAGKQAHERGKHADAVEKFKQSYNLSKNPLLLYNIAVTMELTGVMDDVALFYFRKFLMDAPADAAQRAAATERVKTLEKKFAASPSTGHRTGGARTDSVEIKPPGTYGASDFQHQIVDVAPPAKPLDVTAYVPEDSGFVVTLFFRTAGEGKYASRVMKWRYKELIGRIPAPKMIGTAVQYYIEVKEGKKLVTRSGKATSPNQIMLEAGATPRFYPDVTDDGAIEITQEDILERDDEDDPLADKAKKSKSVAIGPSGPGDGFSDVGSTKFTVAKWTTTGMAVTFIGLGVIGQLRAGQYARSLEDDVLACGAPPCRSFDMHAQNLEDSGKRWQTLSQVAIPVGVGMAAVAGYFWYKDLRAKKRPATRPAKRARVRQETSWMVAPEVSPEYAGAQAAVRF